MNKINRISRDCLKIFEEDRVPIIPGWGERNAKWRQSKNLGQEWNIHQLQVATNLQGGELYS